MSTPQHLKPYESVLETVGWTPLIRLARVGSGLRTPIYGKAEYVNPGGSVKDRIGLWIHHLLLNRLALSGILPESLWLGEEGAIHLTAVADAGAEREIAGAPRLMPGNA